MNLPTETKSLRIGYYLLAILVGSVALTGFIFSPQSPYRFVSPRQAILHGQFESLPVVLLTFSVGVTAAIITQQDLQDNKFALLRLTNISSHQLLIRFGDLTFKQLRYAIAVTSCWMLALLAQHLYFVYLGWQRVSLRQPVPPEFYLRLLIPEVQYVILTGNYPLMPSIFLFSRMAGIPIVPLIVFRIGSVLLAFLIGISVALRMQRNSTSVITLVVILLLAFEIVFFFLWRWPTISFIQNSLITYVTFREKHLFLWSLYYVILTIIPFVLVYFLYHKLLRSIAHSNQT